MINCISSTSSCMPCADGRPPADGLGLLSVSPRADVLFFTFGPGAVLYHQASRRLVVLNRTAALIWCLLAETANPDQIAPRLQQHLAVAHDEATHDVQITLADFQRQGLLQGSPAPEPTHDELKIPLPAVVARAAPGPPYLYQKLFQAPGCLQEICCQDAGLGMMVDAALAHLQVRSAAAAASRIVLASAGQAGSFHIYIDDCLRYAKISKQSVLPHILLQIFGQSCRALDRYLLFHAAVVSQSGRALVFPARVGGGKSTLAAMLVQRGYGYFSDELAVLDVQSLQVLPFAMPMSIKSGSLPTLAAAYPELSALQAHFRPDGKVVRYLRPPATRLPAAEAAAAVDALVFPFYQAGANNRIVPLAKEEALQKLVATCSSDRPLAAVDIKAMLAVVEQAPCFQLEYGDMQKAIRLLGEQTA